MDQWKDHFEKLFEDNTDKDEQNINNLFEEEPTTDYFQLRNHRGGNLKSGTFFTGREVGLDGIVPGLFIQCIDILMLPILHKLSNRLFLLGKFPVGWCESIIVPLHKTGWWEWPCKLSVTTDKLVTGEEKDRNRFLIIV